MKKIPYPYAVALSAALGLFMAVLDNTIVNVSLTAMLKSFGKQDASITINTIQWVITGYFLSQAAVIPIAGYLSTKFGLKRTFLFALAAFTLGSVLCGVSRELDTLFGGGGVQMLIAFRVFQGIGGGMLFPLATSISFNVFPAAERAKSSAVIAIPVLLAPTLGPTVGGILVDSVFEWPSIFFINLPVGLLALFLIWRIVKPDIGMAPAFPNRPGAASPSGAPAASEPTGTGAGKPEGIPAQAGPVNTPRSFDYLGLILSMVGTILVVYAFTLISETKEGSVTPQNPRGDIQGWGYWLVWVLLGAGLVVLAIFSAYELKIAKDPVLDLRLLAKKDFLVATVMTWIVRAVIFGSFFILPLFLEQFQGESAVITGLALMPQGIGAAIGIISGSRLYDRIGPRMQVILGMIALTISSIMLTTVSKDSNGWSFVPILLIRGIGFGWSNLPLQTVALATVQGRALPKASSLYNATAQIFSSIGIAVLTTLFVSGLTTRINDIASNARANRTPPPADFLSQAAAGSMSSVFVIVTIGTALAILVALFLPKKSLKQLQQQGGGNQPAQAQTHTPAFE